MFFIISDPVVLHCLRWSFVTQVSLVCKKHRCHTSVTQAKSTDDTQVPHRCHLNAKSTHDVLKPYWTAERVDGQDATGSFPIDVFGW